MSNLIDRTRENLIDAAERCRMQAGGDLSLDVLIQEDGALIRGCVSAAGNVPRRIFYRSAVSTWHDLVAKDNPLVVALDGVLLALGRRRMEMAGIAKPEESRQQG